jgi:hypothetical protein
MKAIVLIAFLVLSMVVSADLPKINAPVLVDLQHTDPAIFGQINNSLGDLKGESVVGFALIGGGKLSYQNATDLVGLPASTKGWLDKLPDPIGSVSGG